MRLRIAEVCESVLLLLVRLLLPARGRHRARHPLAVPDSPPAPDPLPVEPLLMDTPLVRPYLRALEVSA
ncbi:hypothetical protein ABZY20_14970 [Streptomyces sp. NPDC006624]|uniref:hypothetical protein n=1 Tax=Streptomyces sp. NPDC006624 TaxID=3154892 RepID=UPI0033B79607